MRAPSRLGWLWLPLALVAFMVSCDSSDPTHPDPTGTSFKIVAPHPSVKPDSVNAEAEKLGNDIVEDVELAQACSYGNPGCDPTAYLRVRTLIDRFKARTGCSVLRIRIGANTVRDDLENSGDNMALVLDDPDNGIGAAAVVVAVKHGVIILVPPGMPALYFGVIPVVDCSPHPQPGLGDATSGP